MSTVDFLARPCSGLPLVPCCLVLVGAVLSSAPACIQPRWVWVSDLCLGGVGWWFALLVVSPVVGMVKFLRRHSPVCFLGVVALASAAAAAVRLCPVYLGVAHFTKVESAQTAAELAVFLGRLLLLSWHLL